jgi:hypothetical protein
LIKLNQNNRNRLKVIFNLYYLLGFVVLGYAFYLSATFFYVSTKSIAENYHSLRWLIYILAFAFLSLHFRVFRSILEGSIDETLNNQNLRFDEGHSTAFLLSQRILLESIKFTYGLFYVVVLLLLFFPTLTQYDLGIVYKIHNAITEWLS